MKKKAKKLILARETVLNLTVEVLSGAVGAIELKAARRPPRPA